MCGVDGITFSFRSGCDGNSPPSIADEVEPPVIRPRKRGGARNPLIRRYFLEVVRFAKMALADVRDLTHRAPIIIMDETSRP
jgi:hypothetical protein